METDNYLQIINSAPPNLPAIPPGMMPQTREQSLIILKTLPKQYYAALSPRTIEDALHSVTPPISLFKKEYGEQSLQAILVIILVDLIDFFNIGKTMGQEQLVQTIRLIMMDFYYLNIDDFKLCFDNAKRGRYGKIYDRIDGNIIYGWVESYATERLNVAYPEGNNQPDIASKNERSSNKVDKKFESFRIGYIAKKVLNHETLRKENREVGKTLC